MRSSRTPFTAPDGLPVSLREWAPDEGSPVRACLVLVHGMAEHSGRYTRLASALVGSGWAVYAPDLRGHGSTADPADELGHLPRGGWDAIQQDVAAIVSKARADHPGVPVVLLGHSMGSFVAREYAIRHGGAIDGLVLSGTAGDPGPIVRLGMGIAAAETRLRGERHRSTLLDKLTFGSYNSAFEPARTRFDWLSRDPAEVDAYVADAASGGLMSSSFFTELLGALRPINDAARIAQVPADLPVLVVAGDADPVGANGAGPRRVAADLRAAGVRDVALRLYPGARHEIFNETNREEVTSDLLDWLRAKITDPRD